MAIVINEFEAVADAAPAQPSAASGAAEGDNAAAREALDFRDVAAALRMLACRTLRVWAH